VPLRNRAGRRAATVSALLPFRAYGQVDAPRYVDTDLSRSATGVLAFSSDFASVIGQFRSDTPNARSIRADPPPPWPALASPRL